jgi:prophage regulatory protein
MQDQLLNITDTREAVVLSKSKIYALMAAGGFPRPLKIGKASRWLASEVSAWIQSQAENRSPKTTG